MCIVRRCTYNGVFSSDASVSMSLFEASPDFVSFDSCAETAAIVMLKSVFITVILFYTTVQLVAQFSLNFNAYKAFQISCYFDPLIFNIY